jgi:hypothetical protein
MALSVAYFVVKGLAYSAWCYVGLRLFRPASDPKAWLAGFLGGVRLAMGLGFGFVIWMASSAIFPALRTASYDLPEFIPSALTYLAVYVPVRWIEWGIFDLGLNRDARSPQGFLLGSGSRSRRWRAGGIAISCLADIPVIAAMGGRLPIGRFMC